MALAHATQLPLIIHTRSARDDTIDMLRTKPMKLGVLHCFTEIGIWQSVVWIWVYISFSGIVPLKMPAS